MEAYKQVVASEVSPSMSDNLAEIVRALQTISHQLNEMMDMYRTFATRSIQMMMDQCPHKDELKKEMQ